MKNNKFFTKSERKIKAKKALVLENESVIIVAPKASPKKAIKIFKINDILDKIGDFGMDSLTSDEKAFLISESKK